MLSLGPQFSRLTPRCRLELDAAEGLPNLIRTASRPVSVGSGRGWASCARRTSLLRCQCLPVLSWGAHSRHIWGLRSLS